MAIGLREASILPNDAAFTHPKAAATLTKRGLLERCGRGRSGELDGVEM